MKEQMKPVKTKPAFALAQNQSYKQQKTVLKLKKIEYQKAASMRTAEIYN